jgi:hypothetical protein
MPSTFPAWLRAACLCARTLAKRADPILAVFVKFAALAYYLSSIKWRQ